LVPTGKDLRQAERGGSRWLRSRSSRSARSTRTARGP
jgi:hypothetical protein